jgi:hypothetical protein
MIRITMMKPMEMKNMEMRMMVPWEEQVLLACKTEDFPYSKEYLLKQNIFQIHQILLMKKSMKTLKKKKR